MVSEVTTTPGDACWTLYSGPNGAGEIMWDCGDRTLDPPVLVGSALAWAYGGPWDYSEVILWSSEEGGEEGGGCGPESTENRVPTRGGGISFGGAPLCECVGETTTCADGYYMDVNSNCVELPEWDACEPRPGLHGPADQVCYRLATAVEDSLMRNAVLQHAVRTSGADTICAAARARFTQRMDSNFVRVGLFDSSPPHGGTDSLNWVHIDPAYLNDGLNLPANLVAQLQVRENISVVLLHEMFHVMGHSHSPTMSDPYTQYPFNLTNNHHSAPGQTPSNSCVTWQ